ncbi:MAG: hypothetical protein ACRC62_15845 [Microcoleus sp.]
MVSWDRGGFQDCNGGTGGHGFAIKQDWKQRIKAHLGAIFGRDPNELEIASVVWMPWRRIFAVVIKGYRSRFVGLRVVADLILGKSKKELYEAQREAKRAAKAAKLAADPNWVKAQEERADDAETTEIVWQRLKEIEDQKFYVHGSFSRNVQSLRELRLHTMITQEEYDHEIARNKSDLNAFLASARQEIDRIIRKYLKIRGCRTTNFDRLIARDGRAADYQEWRDLQGYLPSDYS